MDEIYNAIVAALGHHKTLNDTVSPELGCAEAWSAIARDAGIEGIPMLGFSGTVGLNAWLSGNPHFERLDQPEIGATIISPSTMGKHGHVGFFGKFNLQYNNDWGICSNDSSTGLFSEQWSYKRWLDYYKNYLDLDVKIYRWLGN